ncbi:hypothetical protein M8J76_000992 [Diaphorina citri]|nr:hypothetical protein M8J76_000992 [Diaphorina citri]KAI5755025.1 hypothetical protein M8J77_013473 [Diaphorina citri]
MSQNTKTPNVSQKGDNCNKHILRHSGLTAAERENIILLTKENYYINLNMIPSHWKLLNEDYMKYLMHHLFGQIGQEISLKTFADAYTTMVHGTSRVQRRMLWRMLSHPPNPISYTTLSTYLSHLTRTYLEITRNYQDFWAQRTKPILTYKMEAFADFLLTKYAKFKSVDLSRNEIYFEKWIEETRLMQMLHQDVYKCIYSPNYKPFAAVDAEKSQSCLLDALDVIWLNFHLDNPLHETWTLLYSSNLYDDTLRTLADSIVNKGSTVLVMQDTQGNVFGAYTPSVWRESKAFFGSSKCFLFRLDPTYRRLATTIPDKYYMYLNAYSSDSPRGLGIGGPLGTCGLWLDEIYGQGYSSPRCLDFEFGPLLDTEGFVIEHIQVWSVL